ncbi:hypothetical protein Taro_003375, partial [Colocasia esculenta]|nr:hypothetical protein [Colocasia esculenta]
MASRPPPSIPVVIPSDDDDVVDAGFDSDPSPPMKWVAGRRGVPPPHPPSASEPPLFVLVDDDPTPQKKVPFDHTPSFVPETPLTPLSGPSFVRCTLARSSHPDDAATSAQKSDRFAGISGFICLVSEDEESGSGSVKRKSNVTAGRVRSDGLNEVRSFDNGTASSFDLCGSGGSNVGRSGSGSGLDTDAGAEENHSCPGGKEGSFFRGSTPITQVVGDSPSHGDFGFLGEDDILPQPQVQHNHYEDSTILENLGGTKKPRGRHVADNSEKRSRRDEQLARKQQLKEEKSRLIEEKKRKRQEEKLAKEAMKAETEEMKKLQKEKQKWEKGKFALKSIVAEIDTKVVENGSVGGHLLTRFAEKGIHFRITLNPIEKSIVWKMSIPDEISKLSPMGSDVQYILIVYEADEFCSLVTNGALLDHVRRVQSRYPSFTICYLTNRLMSYINKREQSQYKGSVSDNNWTRPPVEEILSRLMTHFNKVHSRHCLDEADVADHIVGLTSGLATCQFRKKITRLSVNANGSLVSKDFIDRHLIKRNVWLKALVAIPKVQPRFAIAIWKKYPTMRSLLNVYMDPNKSVHEKEFLLKDLTVEGLLGNEDRRLGEVCSKRVYRVLMAENGGMKTDDVENGADFFGSPSYSDGALSSFLKLSGHPTIRSKIKPLRFLCVCVCVGGEGGE